MSMPANDNKTPSSLTPTQATIWVFVRQLLIVLGGTTIGAKYLPADTLNYLISNGPAIILQVGGAASVLYGLYRSLRGPTVNSAAALPGATVVLDSQAEANNHPSSSVVGPADPIPAKAA